MTTSVPAYLTWPLLVFMVIVVITRYAFFRSNQYDTYFNNTLALMVLSNLLRERAIENVLADHGILSITAAQQLSLAVMIFAASEFIGFISLWARLSPNKPAAATATTAPPPPPWPSASSWPPHPPAAPAKPSKNSAAGTASWHGRY
ncbi:hypothetical protein BVC93_31305 (plasmid) [Mycobacterium sp. MS1601]|uniref:hypothetical protein n=1 Tax=Mycobacterium sp. MS1601 TaxID=1936029 RepID=UPI0009794E26|nr:hypothetical protein BVC93_31305 [Mycobacterium sp. MS1601]